ncbi:MULTISPECIES: sterol desaturase family protein [unclassified Mycolicibacterium]|uniref:sterol desaturase family protein n=1 Tax=unclassified Mycolicibacterium TaxID=2636767 RepID=UPI0012DDB6DB|nr:MULTISPECIES: sterol desaturase family protein [unclassified Mycolicibacterium]MUL85535.1 sterol desaturase family protein [Mycolicibacterium sp. CBMA 329]MUL88701.1 sterol desaturase family protein [Mycolicibacterium sp. CBMA 331]MUM02005.1 sterol desaturase family protein [Mycolicibacterium sp. CBMA 334]MUM40348.1 sterol desaturase family protein [Mycolicibacterium sp. CBMA 247]MUM44765.1 sterol desaturase family protein [Mycolicibacterium sp. CBMA 294]
MTRNTFTLGDAAREFIRHPSPWMLGTALIVSVSARLAAADWQFTDLLVPVAMLVVFPLAEWIIHVFVLHWRPRKFGRCIVDSLLARDHRRHHVDPRDIPLIFIPWRALLWILPVAVGVALLAFPRPGLGLTFLSFLTVLGLSYEWCHYLVHSDYKPKTRAYRAVWRNHRQHHYKNEHYWFTVTTAGTADRALRTYPDPATVATSPTAKNLHAATPAR